MPQRASTAKPHALRQLRWDCDWTQRKLALHSGASLRTIINIERGRHLPRMDTRRRLLGALGLPFHDHREYFGPLPQERYNR